MRDRKRYFEIARGSAFESAACLDILFAMKSMSHEQVLDGKGLLFRIVSMLSRMISNLADNIHEELPKYEPQSQ